MPSLLEALEQHGQWACDGTWASAIHRSMGALFTVAGTKEVSGTDFAEAATDLISRMVTIRGRAPDGATVVVTGPHGALGVRDAHDARQAVLRHFPLIPYCACSPRFECEGQEVLTVEVALGWWPAY